MRKNRFRARFPKPHTFLPVIHVETLEQARRNVAIAIENGADGVFLINHRIHHRELMHIYGVIATDYSSLFVGLNVLDLPDSRDVFIVGNAPLTLAGLWSDNAWTATAAVRRRAESFLVQRKYREWDGIYFGGVEFKGQEQLGDAAAAARTTMPFVDVITTSGDATGKPPTVEKIRAMADATGDFPLVIASGMSPENVYEYLDADGFLVSSSISKSFTELDPTRVRQFADALPKSVR